MRRFTTLTAILATLSVVVSGPAGAVTAPDGCPRVTFSSLTVSPSNLEQSRIRITNVAAPTRLRVTTHRNGALMYRDVVAVPAGNSTALQGEQLPLDMPQTRLRITATVRQRGCKPAVAERTYLSRLDPL